MVISLCYYFLLLHLTAQQQSKIACPCHPIVRLVACLSIHPCSDWVKQNPSEEESLESDNSTCLKIETTRSRRRKTTFICQRVCALDGSKVRRQRAFSRGFVHTSVAVNVFDCQMEKSWFRMHNQPNVCHFFALNMFSPSQCIYIYQKVIHFEKMLLHKKYFHV